MSLPLRAAALASALASAAALPAQQDAAAVFAEANQLFRAGNELLASDPEGAAVKYRGSALRYETLTADHGIANSKLHYNLANAYLRLDDVGRAVLNYRKALRLDPLDRNVRRNLEFARTVRQDRFEADGGGAVLSTLLFWHFDVSLPARLRVFAAFWLVFWAGLLLRMLGRPWVPGEITVAAGLVAALLLGSVGFDAWQARASAHGVIVAPQTVARQGDGHSYQPAFEEPLHAGSEFRLIEERPGWYQVELPDGRRCWLPAADAELVL